MGIREILFEAYKEFGFERIRICHVTEVTPAEQICSVKTLDTDTELIEVRLMAGSGKGFLCIPAVGSAVIVGSISANEHLVLMYSGLQSIQMLDGTFGGVVKVEDLTSQMNKIEDKVNDLIDWLATHSHPGNGAAPTTPFAGGTLDSTTRNQLENTEVTHGQA
jgi:hypothetical protein